MNPQVSFLAQQLLILRNVQAAGAKEECFKLAQILLSNIK